MAWQRPQGSWHFWEILLGTGKKVFNAELIEACNTLEIALGKNNQKPVTVMLNSQAVIKCLSYQEMEQKQCLVIRAQQTALALESQSREITI